MMSDPMIEVKPCLYCCYNSKVTNYPDSKYRLYNCTCCGEYVVNKEKENELKLKNETADYLFFNKRGAGKSWFIGDRDDFDRLDKATIDSSYLSIETILAFYPTHFSDKIDRALLYLSKLSSYMGHIFSLKINEISQIFFVKRFIDNNTIFDQHEILAQIFLIADYLRNNKYVEIPSTVNGKTINGIKVLPLGWKRIDEIERQNINNKNVFIAMSFDDSMNETREAIKEAVLDCGYKPRIMDEIEHNHQIVPEMLFEIRKSRFVVAELTLHNNGAYFEAGYALGQGKDVIQVCKKDAFGTDGHFDVKQVSTILWESYDDLKERLIKRIKATIEN